MTNVNRYFIDLLLGPLAGQADLDEPDEVQANLDPDDEDSTKEFACLVLGPPLTALSQPRRDGIRTTLAYHLRNDGFDFAGVLASMLPAFPPPEDDVQFFRWIFEALFGDLDKEPKLANVEARDDPSEVFGAK